MASFDGRSFRPLPPDQQKTGDTGVFYEDCVALDCLYSLLKSFRREDGDASALRLADFKFGLQLQADAKKFEDIVVGYKLEGN